MNSVRTSRRKFLQAGLIALGAIGCAPAVRNCGETVADAALPLPSRSVWAWLRMFAVTGDLGTIPSSEAAYRANLHKIDVALAANGGRIQADGTWLQEPWKINPDWPQALPSLARDAGHLYIPIVDNDKWNMDAYLHVLDTPALHHVAADNLVALATSGRFDSPWDGVLLDFEATPTTHRQQLTDFESMLTDRLRLAGVPVGISVACRAQEEGTHDFTAIAQAADFVDLRCYGYRSPPPKSIAPYWWLEASIQFALDQGVEPDQLILGLGNFSKYWPDSTEGQFVEITYDMALQLVSDAGATVEWIESNENGLIRERFAVLGDGHIWIHDGDTHRYGLELVDQYALLGISLFAPGMGDEEHWQVTAAWRSPYRQYLPTVLKTTEQDARGSKITSK